MRKRIGTIVSVAAALSIIFMYFFNIPAIAAAYPETIRVGLYFGSSSASNVAFNSKAGLEIGYYQNGQFVTLKAVEGGKQLIVRKDSYYIKSPSGAVSEYDPSEGIPFDGVTYGPYHIQIGDQFSDYASAESMASLVGKSGIQAYPVFEDGWFLWTGFYSDAIKAGEDIGNLAATLGITSLKVINPSSSRFIVYDANFKPYFIFGSSTLKLTVRPSASNNPRVLSVNSKQYRGEIELRRFSDSDMTVINVINIEEYLYGVVPRELGASSPMEALKAQAVAARTYAYMNMGSYKKWDFDVVNTVNSQVYGGYDDEHPNTNKAVDETKGKKVLYNGSLASLFYFSSSGGMTEDNVNVWGKDIPYLKSVPDPYESGTSYNYNWSVTLTAEQIKMKLFLSGVDIGDVLSMTAEEYTPAGRVNKLKITGTKGSITYTKEDIRRILGDNGAYLPSRMFTINTSGSGGSGQGNSVVFVITGSGKTTVNVYNAKVVTASGVKTMTSNGAVSMIGTSGLKTVTGNIPAGTYILTGKGWGHGVGMSQEGAKGLAKMGYNYEQILKHYFTGVTVE